MVTLTNEVPRLVLSSLLLLPVLVFSVFDRLKRLLFVRLKPGEGLHSVLLLPLVDDGERRGVLLLDDLSIVS